MHYTYKDIPVYYEVMGEGQPVLLIHGFMPDHRLMKGCFEPIFQSLDGYKRIYLDLPGMGQTPGSEAIQKADDLLDLILAFIEDHLRDTPFLLCGESYGGYLARGILSEKKDQVLGLHLTCPVILPDSKSRILPPHRVIVKDQNLLDQLSQVDAEEFSSISVVQSPEIYQRFCDEIMPGILAADEDYLIQYQKNGYGLSFDVDKRVGTFEAPALFLMGRQDAVVGYADALHLLERYPRATFSVLDAAGHNLQIEQANVFETCTLEWLNRVAVHHAV